MAFRILNAEPDNYSTQARLILQTFGTIEERHMSREELIKNISDYEALIVRLGIQIDREIIDAGKKLRVISTATTGLDHVDVEYAKSKGITVLSLKGEYAFLTRIPATAELTWALLLALIRHIPRAHASVLRGERDRDLLRGHDLSGKSLSILGLGRIGEKVAKYGIAFGMHVMAWDPLRSGWMEGVYKADSLNHLLSAADVLSIHLPLNEQTRRFLKIKELAMLQAGSYLINTARGDLLDSKELLRLLFDGKLAGAALDVMPGERELTNDDYHLLIEYAQCHDNLILTPHIGGATYESMAMTELFMAEKLSGWVEKMYATDLISIPSRG
jgi:D-3-phosphoglycerate dehydrogenase / 2-oxoglutarate reductase